MQSTEEEDRVVYKFPPVGTCYIIAGTNCLSDVLGELLKQQPTRNLAFSVIDVHIDPESHRPISFVLTALLDEKSRAAVAKFLEEQFNATTF